MRFRSGGIDMVVFEAGSDALRCLLGRQLSLSLGQLPLAEVNIQTIGKLVF